MRFYITSMQSYLPIQGFVSEQTPQLCLLIRDLKRGVEVSINHAPVHVFQQTNRTFQNTISRSVGTHCTLFDSRSAVDMSLYGKKTTCTSPITLELTKQTLDDSD